MKNLLILSSMLVMVWSCTPGGQDATSADQMKTFADSASYAQGMFMGKQLKTYQEEGADPLINPAFLKIGLEDAIAGNEDIFTEDQITEVLNKFQTQLMDEQTKKAALAGAKNREKGQAFLDDNAKKDGVSTTESGLQYKVLEEGTGPMPTTSDIVEVHYEGRLLDGTVFDSSIQKGVPAKFALTAVIRGWTEGLQLMKEGAKYQFYIHADLAYGDIGSRPNIEAGETLIFDVELLKVNP